MQTLMAEWKKELEISILPRQWEEVLTSILKISIDLRLHLIQ